MELYEIEELQRKIKEAATKIEKNKGRLEQLKETAMAQFKVNTVEGLQALKNEYLSKEEMEQAKVDNLSSKLQKIVPPEILNELR